MGHSSQDIRAFLITEAFWCIDRVVTFPELRRIALLCSIGTPKADPKGVDILITIDDGVDLTALATAARRLKGIVQRKNNLSGVTCYICASIVTGSSDELVVLSLCSLGCSYIPDAYSNEVRSSVLPETLMSVLDFTSNILQETCKFVRSGYNATRMVGFIGGNVIGLHMSRGEMKWTVRNRITTSPMA